MLAGSQLASVRGLQASINQIVDSVTTEPKPARD